MSIRNEIAKNNIVYTFGNIFSALLSFIFSIVVARLLQPEQFGLFSFALVVMGFFTIFIDLGITSTFVRFASECIEKKQRSKVRSLISMFFKLRVALTVVIVLLMLVFSDSIAGLLFNKPGQGIFIMLAAGLLASSSVFEFLNMVFLSFKNFKYMVGLRVAERLLRVSFVVLLVIMGTKAFGAVVGVMAGYVVVVLLGLTLLRKYSPFLRVKGPKFEKKLLIRFGFWAFLGTVIISLYGITDALLISALRSIEEVGFYNIAASWMTLIAYLVPVSNVVMYPYFSRFSKEKNFEALQNSIKYSLLIAMPMAFLMSALSSPIIDVFYKSAFSPAAQALSMLSFASVTLVMSQLLNGYFYGIGKPKIHTMIISLVFVFDLLISYFMINMFGIWGAALALVAARLVELAILFSFIRFSLKLKMGWQGIIKPAIGSVVIYIIASWLAVSGFFELVFYGVILLLMYVGIMLAIGGIEKGDVFTAMAWLYSRIKHFPKII